MTERNTTIDFLRGLSVILIVLIHVNAYFLHLPVANILANYSQFAVQIFVFCSAFLYFERKKDSPFNLSYVWKRIKRLLIPYYIFLIFFFSFIYIFKQEAISVGYLRNWILLQGGRDLHWLVVLFLQFLFLMPFIRFIQNKRFLFWTYMLVSVGSSLLLLFINVPIHFRIIMWLPWSTILLYAYFYANSKKKDKFIIYAILLSGLVYFISQYILEIQKDTLTFTDNKYPPNLFYLSYGTFWISLLIFLHQKLQMHNLSIQRFFNFASKYSYQIFFIHFLYLYLFLEIDYKKFHWWGLFFIITFLSLGSMWLWNYFFSTLKKAN